MVPMGRFRDKCAEAFTQGEHYKLEAIEERSWKSHQHYFACVHDGWLNLPEQCAMETWAQSSEHLRKYALIKTGWFNSQTHVCDSEAEATRWATRLRPRTEFGIVVARGTTVIEYEAQTQSMKGMGKADFQKSKDDVLGFIASLSGSLPEQLGGAA